MTSPLTLPPLPTVGTGEPAKPDTWGAQLNAYLDALAAATGQAASDAAAAQADSAAAAAAAQAAAAGLPDTVLRRTPAQVEYDWAGAAYPLRSTVTTDLLRVVVWRGPTAPVSGNGFAIPGVDEWKIKAAQ